MKKEMYIVCLAPAMVLGFLLLFDNIKYHDRCQEQELWFQCINELPANAKDTAQWASMIDECQIKAERQSVTAKEKVPEGCLW